jgi:YD repeat-containing protein
VFDPAVAARLVYDAEGNIVANRSRTGGGAAVRCAIV